MTSTVTGISSGDLLTSILVLDKKNREDNLKCVDKPKDSPSKVGMRTTTKAIGPSQMWSSA